MIVNLLPDNTSIVMRGLSDLRTSRSCRTEIFLSAVTDKGRDGISRWLLIALKIFPGLPTVPASRAAVRETRLGLEAST